MIDLVTETYDSELDVANRWVVDVTVTLFDTPARAARDLDDSCYSFAHGGGAGGVRWQQNHYCISSVLHLRNDLRTHLPVDNYFSWVMVRRDRLVVRLYERHNGSTKSAKNRIIQEIAERLSGAPPAAPAH